MAKKETIYLKTKKMKKIVTTVVVALASTFGCAQTTLWQTDTARHEYYRIPAIVAYDEQVIAFALTSSSCHPKFFVKEFSYFLMPCHQHCLGINLLVQR